MKTVVEKKPFWVSDDEFAGLSATPQDDLSEKLASPEFTKVEASGVVGEYAIVDGLISYHIYDPRRKKIYDKAQDDMFKARAGGSSSDAVARAQGEVAKVANAELDENPWPEHFGDTLATAVAKVFKYAPHKIAYYKEVDSWSVILPEETFPLGTTPDLLESLFTELSSILEG